MLNPWFLCGFIDGEGSFSCSLVKNKKTTGWKVIVIFSIILHVRDIELLKKIKICLGVGRIYISHTREAVVLEVQSIQSILILIQHLDKYPLITKKHADNVLFKEIINIIKKKEHLTLEGLAKIIALKGSMNRGLSDKLKLAFPHVILVERPIVTDQTIKNPYWLAGFVSAEGCFYVDIFKSQTKIGWAIKLGFKITQHSRDEDILRIIKECLGCGGVYKKGVNVMDYRVTKFENIMNIVIPFFQKHKIEGIKAKDFEDWIV